MIFWFLACSGDKVVAPYNNAPTILITSHAENSVFTEGNTYEFWAAVEDLNHSSEDLEVAWYLSSDSNAQNTLVCDWSPVSAASESICSIPLSVGDTKILAQVQDPDDANGIHELPIIVEGLNPPEIVIHSPEDERTYYSNILIDFSATIDEDSLDGTETVLWTSSTDGELGLDTSYDIEGNLSDVSYLSVGEHSISLDIDRNGQRLNRETVRINVVEENSPPVCTILSPDPSDVHSFDLGSTIIFQGQVTDPDIPNNELIVQWSSNVDGTLLLGNPDSDGDTNFSTSILSNDTHTITLQAQDEVGELCSQQMVVDIFFESQTCGNSQIDFGEDCDGANLNNLQCTDLGYSGGSLACDSISCQFDESGCSTPSSVCGNSQIEAGEDCEGSDLNNQSCTSQGFDGGSLSCNSCSFDTSSCWECGDGNVDSGEQCDTWNLNSQDCVSLGYAGGGSLSCTNSCTFDISSCNYSIDLDPGTPNLSSYSLSPSDSVTVSGTIYNNGSDSSGSFAVRVYHSTNSSLSTSSDTQLDSWTQGSISGNSSGSYSRTVSIPSNLSASTDYIFVTVDPSNTISETDENNNEASTSFTVITCTANDYWSPTLMSNSETHATNGVTLTSEIQDANSGGYLELRICKSGGTFSNDIFVTFEEWYHYTGYGMVDQSISSANSTCSSWVNLNTSSGWSDGDGFGGDMQIVSPDYCGSTWGWACSDNGSTCGDCWFIATSVLTRTCKN